MCHSGTLNRGHYYSFLRVGGKSEEPEVAEIDPEAEFDDGSWVKFNDQTVCPTFKHVAIGTG